MTRNNQPEPQFQLQSQQEPLPIRLLESMPRVSLMEEDNNITEEEKVSIPCPPMTIMEDPTNPTPMENEYYKEREIIACPAPTPTPEQIIEEDRREVVEEVVETYIQNLNNYCINDERDLDNYFENPNMEIRNDCKYTPLFYLCYNYKHNCEEYINRLKILIQRNVKMNYCHKTDKYTPLTTLLLKNRDSNSPNIYNIVKLLIEGGADVNYEDKSNYIFRNNDFDILKGTTPLVYASLFSMRKNLQNIIPLLINNGANVNMKSKYGLTPLMFTAADTRLNSSIGTLRLLINNGADLNLQDDNGCTALMHACKSFGKFSTGSTIKILIDSGTDVNIVSNDGDTALRKLCRLYSKVFMGDYRYDSFYNYLNKEFNNNKDIYNHIKNNIVQLIYNLIDAGTNVNTRLEYRNNALLDLFDVFYINTNPLTNNIYENIIPRLTKNMKLYSIIEKFIKNGIHLNFRNERNDISVLVYLLRFYPDEELLKIIKLLIDNDIIVNDIILKYSQKWTPLTIFIYYNYYSNQDVRKTIHKDEKNKLNEIAKLLENAGGLYDYNFINERVKYSKTLRDYKCTDINISRRNKRFIRRLKRCNNNKF
jgi:ankyrin repeat protein